MERETRLLLLDAALGPQGGAVAALVQAACRGRSALVLEDEPLLAARIVATLTQAGFSEVFRADVGEAALAMASQRPFDILILDRQNPGLDGLEVLRRLRAGGTGAAAAKALILTWLDSPAEMLAARLSGAGLDDYVSKAAIEWEELLSRIVCLLARTPPADAPNTVHALGAIAYTPHDHQIRLRGTPLVLPGRNHAIMAALLAAEGRPLTHLMLWERCWPEWTIEPEGLRGRVDTAVSRLRKLLREQAPDALKDHVFIATWNRAFHACPVPTAESVPAA